MASSSSRPITGMSDISAPEVFLWQHLEEKARRLFSLYGFEELRTPILEYTDVFERSLGETTDVVQKEMYTFEDTGGRSITLRPEGTAGVIRHVVGLNEPKADRRLFYLGPMFRCERPQAGRKRQFHQLGAESVTEPNEAADVELMALQLHVLSTWGLEGATLQVNTRGLPEDRASVVAGLRELLEPRRSLLCENCRRRLDQNVFRVLDCKNPACQAQTEDLPPLTEFMSTASKAYFKNVVGLLDRLGISAEINPKLVRGLDYYVHTVWEITHAALGSQDSLSGGGRYRIFMHDHQVDGVGFALGLERVLTALEHQNSAKEAVERKKEPLVRFVSQGEEAFGENFGLVHTLRNSGVRCSIDLSKRSLKAQMRAAHRTGATVVVIRGEQELERECVQVKDMSTGEQQEVELSELVHHLTCR